MFPLGPGGVLADVVPPRPAVVAEAAPAALASPRRAPARSGLAPFPGAAAWLRGAGVRSVALPAQATTTPTLGAAPPAQGGPVFGATSGWAGPWSGASPAGAWMPAQGALAPAAGAPGPAPLAPAMALVGAPRLLPASGAPRLLPASGAPRPPPEAPAVARAPRPTLPVAGAARPAPGVPAAGDGDVVWEPPLAHSVALMTATRLVEAYLYPEPFARVDLGFWADRYRDAFTKPPIFDSSLPAFRWDGDPWAINVIGHGLMGSEYYVRARACRFSPFGAFAFAAGASVVWEYAFEANGVRPSALDLVYTPLAGLALGEARYQAWRAAGRLASPGWRAVVRAAADPFGELARGAGLFSC